MKDNVAQGSQIRESAVQLPSLLFISLDLTAKLSGMPSKFKNPPGSHLQKCRSNPAGFLKVHLYWSLIHVPIWIMVFATGTYVHVSLIGILGGGPLYYRFCWGATA